MLNYAAPASAVLALIVAFVLANWVKHREEGTDRMSEIAGHIREGAFAFLKSEYKFMIIVVAVVFVLLFFFVNKIIFPEAKEEKTAA